MKNLNLILITIFVLFFNGCSGVIEPEPKVIYIKQNIPKQRTLFYIKKYEITDWYRINDRYIAVNYKQLVRASKTSGLLRKQNKFYRSQATKFNTTYTNKD